MRLLYILVFLTLSVQNYGQLHAEHAIINIEGEKYWVGEYVDDFAVISKNGYFGYANKNKSKILKPIYDYAFPFKNGLARVKLKGKYGVIDTSFSIVIKPVYTSLDEFHDGVTIGYKSNAASYISRKGKTIASFKGLYIKTSDLLYSSTSYGGIYPFNEGVGVVSGLVIVHKSGEIYKLGLNFWLDHNIDADTRFNNGLLRVASRLGGYTYLNKQGDKQINNIFSYAFSFNKGYAIIEDSIGRHSFIDTNGNIVKTYDFINDYNSSERYVVGDNPNQDSTLFDLKILDDQLNEISTIKNKYSYSLHIIKDILTGNYSYFNIKGEFLMNIGYYESSRIKLPGEINLHCVADKSGLKGFMNSKGEVIIPAIHNSIKPISKHCFLGRIYDYDNKTTYSVMYDEKGNVLRKTKKVKNRYRKVSYAINDANYILITNEKDGYSYTTLSGSLITDLIFPEVASFGTKGYSFVKNNENKWGVIDMAGLLIKDFIYDDLSLLVNKTIVKVDGKWYYFSLSTKKLKKVPNRKL